MTSLEAKNQILAYLGEEPIDSDDAGDYIVNKINVHWDVVRRQILDHGFSFNTDTVTLEPSDGQVTVPGGTSKIRFQRGYDFLTTREGMVWDNRSNGSYWSSPVTVQLTQDISFEKLPDVFANWVMIEIAIKLYQSVNGTVNPLMLDDRKRAKARALNSEPGNLDDVSGWGPIKSAYGA